MKTLSQAIDEADNRWQHGIGNSGANWEDYMASAVSSWLIERGQGCLYDCSYCNPGDDDEDLGR